MIYINGKKASEKDKKILMQNLKEGKTQAKAHTTKKGLEIVTSC